MIPDWVKKGESAAIRGKVKDDFTRFNQKYHLFLRGSWDTAYAHQNNAYYSLGMKEQINKGAKGYAREDWAFISAATATLNQIGFEYHTPNSGTTSWASIARKHAEGTLPVGTKLPPYENEPFKNTRLLKHISHKFGASDTGVCLLDRRWVYSEYYDQQEKKSYPIRFSDEEGLGHITKPTVLPDKSQVIPKEMKYVLVFIYEMQQEEISVAGQFVHNSETSRVYGVIANHTLAVAEYIRALGFHAIPSSNCTAQNVPLAIDAGLGESSRMGKLVHPVYGPRCRIGKIITDLPLVLDTPIEFGVQAFCEICTRCADMCPAKAISKGEKTYLPFGDYANKNVYMWPFNHDKCKLWWHKIGNNCGRCIAACPFNKPDTVEFQQMKRTICEKPDLNPQILKEDTEKGYGRAMQSRDYWKKYISADI